MNLTALAASLGIGRDVSYLEEAYARIDPANLTFCDAVRIRALEETYRLLGDGYLDLALRGAAALRNDPLRLRWGQLVAEFCNTAPAEEFLCPPIPASDGSPAGDLLPLLLLLDFTPDMIRRFREKGFSEEVLCRALSEFRAGLDELRLKEGRPMINEACFDWCMQFVRATAFPCHAFKFRLCIWDYDAMLLKHRTRGTYAWLMTAGRFHKNGMPLGSAGCPDGDGAFDADFCETPEAYTGHTVADCKVSDTRSGFSKQEWTCVLNRGDRILNFRIPRNTDLTPAYVSQTLEEGMAIAQTLCHGAQRPKFLFCHSWLLSPELPKLLGEHANITQFSSRFLKFPARSKAEAYRTYVFPGCSCDVRDLPEDTSLRRGIKQLLLQGGYIYETVGVIPAKDE